MGGADFGGNPFDIYEQFFGGGGKLARPCLRHTRAGQQALVLTCCAIVHARCESSSRHDETCCQPFIPIRKMCCLSSLLQRTGMGNGCKVNTSLGTDISIPTESEGPELCCLSELFEQNVDLQSEYKAQACSRNLAEDESQSIAVQECCSRL